MFTNESITQSRSSNQPRTPSWFIAEHVDRNDYATKDTEHGQVVEDQNETSFREVMSKELKFKQRAKILVETSRTVLRRSQALKALNNYLYAHIHDIFISGKMTPMDPDFRELVVKSWIEELLRFLALKILMEDVDSPCSLGASVPIDIAWEGLAHIPSIFKKLCKKLDVETSRFGHDLSYEYKNVVDATLGYAQKVQTHSNTLSAYRNVFEQDPPELYWPAPQAPPPPPLAAIVVDYMSTSVTDFLKEAHVPEVKHMFRQTFVAEVDVPDLKDCGNMLDAEAKPMNQRCLV